MGKLSRSRAIAGVAAAAAAMTAPQIVIAQTLVKIRMGGVPTDDLTPVFYALQQGWYARAGIHLEFWPTSSGTAATQAAVTGAYELGKGSLIAALLAHIRGLPLPFIANGCVWNTKNRLPKRWSR